MKNEAEFCSIISRSMINGFKIPDPTGMFAMTSKRAFDGIGMLKESTFTKNEKDEDLIFICWEAKYLSKMQAFSFSRIEEHQNFYLSEYRKAKNIKSLVLLGIDNGRSDKRAYIFEWTEEMSKLYENNFSVHKKFLDLLPYNKVSKGTFNFDKIITNDIFESVYGCTIQNLLLEPTLSKGLKK